MKKSIFTLAILAVSAMASAQTITAAFDITMKGSPSGTPDEVHLYQITEASATSFDNEYEATKLMNTTLPTSVNIYVTTSYGTLSDVALPDFLGLPITIQTNATETSYSFTFANVEGEVKLLDSDMDSVINVVEGGTYNFTTPVGKKTYADRFFIYKGRTPDPGDLSICHRYGELQILNNPFQGKIVVKNAAGAVVLSKSPMETPQIISLAELPAGRYTVEMNNGSRVLSFKVQ